MESLSGVGSRVIELQGLCRAIQLRCVCSECEGGPIEVQEDMHPREGLVTHPYLYCTNCGGGGGKGKGKAGGGVKTGGKNDSVRPTVLRGLVRNSLEKTSQTSHPS